MGAHYEAMFSFETLMTLLLDCKNIDRDEQPIDLIPKGPTDTIGAKKVASHAKLYGEDFLNIKFLPPEVREAAAEVLFHERAHYWQMISSTIKQKHFLVFLSKLKKAARKNNLNPHNIYGSSSFDISNALDIASAYRELNFDAGEESFQAEVVLPLFHPSPLIHPAFGSFTDSQGNRLPGFAVKLGFGIDDKPATVIFTLKSIIESATYISECIYFGKPMPIVMDLSSEEDRTYLGAWELFRRLYMQTNVMFISNFSIKHDVRAAGIAFLAAVDLALNGELGGEMSVSYRFGMIILKMMDLGDIKLADGDPANVVATYQDLLCQKLGWTNPIATFRKSAVWLTNFLLHTAIARGVMCDEVSRRAVVRFSFMPSDEIAENFQMCDEIWRLIRGVQKNGPRAIGESVAGAMLNALVFRLEHPGKFAIPQLYATELDLAFPLPVINWNGGFFYDLPYSDSGQSRPYDLGASELAQDCVTLLTMAPLIHGETSCGFLRNFIPCCHVGAHWGCPQRGLSPDEVRFREQTHLDDWCHWRATALRLNSDATDSSSRKM